jgi:hypothetical protein
VRDPTYRHPPEGDQPKRPSEQTEDLRTCEIAMEENGFAQPEREGVDHGEIDDRWRLVDGRLAQHVLISVVQPDDLADEQDEGDDEEINRPEVDLPAVDESEDEPQGCHGGDDVDKRQASPQACVTSLYRVTGTELLVALWEHLPYRRNVTVIVMAACERGVLDPAAVLPVLGPPRRLHQCAPAFFMHILFDSGSARSVQLFPDRRVTILKPCCTPARRCPTALPTTPSESCRSCATPLIRPYIPDDAVVDRILHRLVCPDVAVCDPQKSDTT